MFNDDVLELIFADEEVRTVPLAFQAIIIHSIEKILEENGYKVEKKEV